MEECFFKAYFTEGALLSDHQTLLSVATEGGATSGSEACPGIRSL